MEAIKRLPMISFELKNSPEATSFHNLKQCIAEYYHEDPDSYGKEFRELEQLRGLAVRPRIDFECCSTVKRYYSQLHSLQNRFPLSSENELLDFAWKDLYSGSLWRTSNIKFEMASILYNIAALHSQLGIEESRSDPESMKIACTHFQCAAWAFGEIKNQYPLVLKGDLSTELMIFMQQICFGHAQECILEKSLADNRKPAIIAKVTAQVISFYNAALSALFSQNDDGSIQDLVGTKLYKDWLKYIKFKTSYLSSILFLYQGMHSEEQRKMGERVVLYNAACERLEEAKKESKGMNKIELINEALILMTDIVEGKRKNAKQENEFIYHESIPEFSSISAVQGANLVQGIPFDVTDPQVIGDDVFKRLVPMKTHEHLSVYSEEKANILRSLGSKIDDRDAELASFMGSLNTESLNAMGHSQERLPQGLVDRCAELSAKPNAISDLVDSMSNLADICCDVEMTLKDIKKILDDEAKQEQNFQKKIGKRPTGHMTELSREFTKYFEAHNKAGESNDTLRKAMELHVINIIDQNLIAQGNILKALTDTYAKHAMTLKSYTDTKMKREQFYSSLIASYDVYEDLMLKSAKGLDFYKKLHGNVQKLMSRVKAARDVQEEERQQLFKNSQPKAPPVEVIKPIDTSYMMTTIPSSGGGSCGPKLKDYLKSGMVSGLGGLRDELNKLPGVRPNPVGQENISNSNPVSCPSMNYVPPSNYRNHVSTFQPPGNQQQPQQHSSINVSLSSSNTSLNSDYFMQGGLYGQVNNIQSGYVNPIYQTTGQQPYQNISHLGYNQTDPSIYQQSQQQPQPTATYGTHATNNYGQQPQFDYYKNQKPVSVQPPVEPSPATNVSQCASKINPVVVDQTQSMYQNQWQQYPVAPSPSQQFVASYTPNTQQYAGQPPSVPISQQSMPSTQEPASMLLNQQQYAMNYSSNISQQASVGSQQNFFNYNTPSQMYPTMNQYGQQNYSCYTPTINSMNSYMTATDNATSQSHTTQSENYYEPQAIIGHAQSHAVSKASSSVNESPQRQPNSIPTYTTAINATSTNNSETHATQSQQQISSSIEKVTTQPHQQPTQAAPTVSKVKSKNIDLLSGIDFSMTNPTIENVPTLTPVSAKKFEAEEAATKSTLASPIKHAKINDDLADLDFDSLNISASGESLKVVMKDKQQDVKKKFKDPFEDGVTLKSFHKEVESLEKFMETLTVKTLNGVTPLTTKWKELQDLVVKEEGKRSVSIARLFPDKNRSVDCLPYDHARVVLPTATDNYINAVIVKDCGPIRFILTQTPMANTINDYWEMVWMQKANSLVCLHTSNELLDPFWPQNVGEEKTYGDISVVATKQFDFSHCHEMLLKVTKNGCDGVIITSLLQVTTWKKNSPDHILDVAGNTITSYKQQNPDNQHHSTMILNCISGGAERSGLMTLGISSILGSQMRKPTLLNVIDHWYRICSHRKGALEDERLIQLSLEIVLTNAHRILNKRGIMTSYQMKNAEKLSANVETEKSVKDTGLDSLDPFWKFK
ncbi:CLUMA_CG015161, isoform A [Clunio marinus]|uniref:CLUMA_CG015161, isoform A n=1 Tax=Clunio marinus TaxID=568069 RepID=A0A1J1IQK6_9DIPT|nr:CLUMA_CG015161, isoform A [Clunio marinus]